MKPWERYQQEPQQQPAAAPKGPWERYAGAGEAAPAVEEQPSNFYTRRIEPALKAVGDAGRAVQSAVVGKQDPRFKDIPTVEQSGLVPLGDLNQAKLTAPNDKAYADIIAKMLGPRLVGRETDANGYPVFSIYDDKGNIFQAYVNKPGLDWEDVDRGISGAVPYMFGAGLAGRAAQTAGMGLLGRAAVQGGTAAGVNAGQQGTQQGLGSRQPFDFAQAGLAGAFGAGGEVLGAAITPFVRRYFKSRAIFDESGKLTARGKKLAEKNGLDPNAIDDAIAQRFKALAAESGDPSELLKFSVANEFGIRTTRGQRTGNPDDLLQQEALRRNVYGNDRGTQMRNFLEVDQPADIQFASLGAPGGIGSRAFEAGQRPGVTPIAETLAPHRRFMDQRPDVLGGGIKEGFDRSVRNAKAFENQAWQGVNPNIQARIAAKQQLPDVINKVLAGAAPDKLRSPGTSGMLDELMAFTANKAPNSDYAEWMGAQAVTTIHAMRQRLAQRMSEALPGNDKRTATAVFRAYNKWIHDAAKNKQIMGGSLEDVDRLLEAIKATRQARTLIDAKLQGGTKSTPASKIMEKLKDAETGEDALFALIGRGTGTGDGITGGVQGVQSYKRLLDKFGGPEGKMAWDDLRLAYWKRLVSPDDKMMSPGALANNIRGALYRQGSLTKTLFSEEERKIMLKFANAMAAIKTPATFNNSGTAYTNMRFMPKAVRGLLQAQAARETLVKGNILRGRMLRFIAEYVKAFDKPAGGPVLRDTVSQELRGRVSPSLSGYVTGPAGGAAPFRPDDN